ncbi:hypothetical protein HPB50_020967 [Hyalomma asiaticum]|uniref:Uncharacterized protein n=1 Tax=Hyalomma asiaticum TaxID=266040 RepID=A0ACB7T3R8_HYAAI|nr:hypothetical protein HPB50_020967 [Hyalomma asiaticum]
MAASAGAASRKRTGLQSGAYSDDTSVYSLSSEDCSDDDFQLVRSRKAKRRNDRPSLYIQAKHATSNLRRLNRQSVSVLLEAVAPNEVIDVSGLTNGVIYDVDASSPKHGFRAVRPPPGCIRY